jgi:hypothetical protein
MGFEPTIPASERAKTVHALDRAATVTSEGLRNTRRNLRRADIRSEIRSMKQDGFVWYEYVQTKSGITSGFEYETHARDSVTN